MTRLIIARHGNTFERGEAPRRVGGRTDLPLVDSGRAQAEALGRALLARGDLPDLAFASRLQRTQETARLALHSMGRTLTVEIDERLDEIDYGPDENQPEAAVIARLGAAALAAWDERNAVPPGWRVDPQKIKADWRDILDAALMRGGTSLVVTSNGIARFLPELCRLGGVVTQPLRAKLATGAFGVLVHDGQGWVIEGWNITPDPASAAPRNCG